MASTAAVVNNGLATITSRLIGTATAVPHHVAWGTGTGVVAVTNTTLTEPGEARTTGTGTQQTTTYTSDTHRVTGTITATGTRAITECGLWTDATAGTLYCRGLLAATINLTTGDSVALTFNIQYTSSVITTP